LLKTRSQDRALWTAIVVTMFVVLGALGVLQYRWSKRVSDATQARIDASLMASVMDWHLSLLHEISEPCFAMQISSEPDNHEDWDKYFQRYEEWHGTAKRPALFANVYLVEIPKEGHDSLYRLDVGQNRFYPETWPSRLHALRQELTQQSANPETLERSATDDPHTTMDNPPGQLPHDPLYGWQFEANLPALVHPLLHSDVGADAREGHTKVHEYRGAAAEERREHDTDEDKDNDADDIEPAFWVVIELDPKLLSQQVLPELAQHYFGGPQGANYNTAVIVGRSERVLYASSPEFLQDPYDHPDVVLDIFGPPAVGGPPLSHDFAGDFHTGGAKPATRADERRSLAAPSWFPVMQDTGHNAHWNLVVRHRSGSLEAQMAAMRRRDMAISLGVLLLLGATMTMLIVATRRAQRLARQQMDFVATVSHELRTPLAVICSAADNLSDGVVSGKQQLARYGETIKIQGKQLIALVEQILLFASTRDGRQVYHLEFLDVRRIVDVVLTNTAGLLEVSDVRLESHVDAELPQVVGDLAAISQCLQNLVINAVKYGGDEKWIGVRAMQAATDSGDEIQISVEDRGIGMSSDDLEHIFEPFYRSPQVAAAQIRGTGLGLPLAKTLAEAMSGSLTVTSKAGKGSVFTLHLPFAENSPLRAAVQEASDKILTNA
jgi:signal transduction histidine kinase